MKKNIIKISCLLVVSILLVGCSLFGPAQKEYSKNGISIKLDDNMEYVNQPDYAIALKNENVTIFAKRYTIDGLIAQNINKDSTLKEYSETLKIITGIRSDMKEKDGISYMDYEKEVENKTVYYRVALYKEKDIAFWSVIFAFKNENELNNNFIRWAKTVKFGE